MNNKEITIVTGCKDREENLKKVLPSWIAFKPKKIIIIDWGSKKKIQKNKLNISDKEIEIEIIRVETDVWIASWALNLGFEKVKTKYTMKLDNEIVLSKKFLLNKKLSKYCFYRGHYKFVKAEESYINGSFLSCSELLRNVGFYDERINTYGYEDCELYERLSKNCKYMGILNTNDMNNIEQGEETRTINQMVGFENLLAKELNIPVTVFLIHRNRIFSKMINEWNSEMYKYRETIKNYYLNLENEDLMQSTYETFIDLFETKDQGIAENRFRTILEIYSDNLIFKNNCKLNKTSKTKSFKSLLLVIPENGICNRLRIISSAFCLAKRTNRKLIICWDLDSGMKARLEDLFKIPLGLGEVDVEICDSSILSEIVDCRFYNFSEALAAHYKKEFVDHKTDLPIIIKGSDSFLTEFNDENEEIKFLSNLEVNSNILELINKIRIDENTVGVHVRYEDDKWQKLPSEDKNLMSNDKYDLLVKHRNNSKPENFVSKMTLILQDNPKAKFFISSPTKYSKDYLFKIFGDKVFFQTHKQKGNREKNDLFIALADLFILSKCHNILGSEWSSFTEIAIKMNHSPSHKIEIVGSKNFPIVKNEPILDLTTEMLLGENAVRKKSLIKSVASFGTLVYGPYKLLYPAEYILNIEIFNSSKFIKEKNFLKDYITFKKESIKIEIVLNEKIFYTHEIQIDKEYFIAEIPFKIKYKNSLKKVQFRLMNFGFNGSLGFFHLLKV